MKNFFTSGRGLTAIFATVLVILFLGVSYLYVYIPSKERRIREQGFRAMQNIDRNIQAKIQNSVSLLNNILSAYIDNKIGQDSIQSYIKKNAFGSFKLTPIVPIEESVFKKLFGTNGDRGYNIREDTASQQYILSYYKNLYGQQAYVVSMEMDIDQFFKPLMPNNILFDEYIVFKGKKTAYQTFPSGLSEVNQDSLMSTKSGVKGATIQKKEIGGTVYQMFLQPVSFTPASKLIIAGLLNNEKYEYEKKQLPSGTVQFLFIVALAIIILFPALKLYYVGSKDRLTIFDGISAVAISMLLMSLLFFVLFKYNVQFRQLDTPDSKDVLSKKIVAAFKTEVTANYNILAKLDTLASKNVRSQIDIAEVGKTDSLPVANERNNTKLIGKVYGILKENNFNKEDFNQVYWLKQSGQEWFKWDSLKYNGPHGNFGQRNYVKNILVKKAYLLKVKKPEPYYLDQIISWTTGTFTTVISRQSVLSSSKNTVVEAFAFNMKSLDQVVLPAGYTFAMIDNRGNVLYHADKNRNLKENLLQEFSQHEELQSCIEAHAQKSFRTGYMGKDYIVAVTPISGLPYFIAVFSDVSYIDTRDVEIYCFTLALLFAFFCFLVLEMAAVFLASSKGSYFKKQRFYINWTGPKASFHRYYILSSVLNIVFVLLLNFAFKASTFAEFFFMLLFSATASLVFLMCLFARRYRKDKEHALFTIKKRTIRALLVFIGLINLMAVLTLDSLVHFFVFETVTLLLALLMFVLTEKWVCQTLQTATAENAPKAKNQNFANSFTLMVLTRLIITSGLPVVLFYVMAYNYEQNLLIRYRHYDFARKLIEKGPTANNAYFSAAKNSNVGVYTDNSWIGGYSYSTKNDTVKAYHREEKLTIDLLQYFHFFRDSSAIRENHLYQQNANDSSFFYNHLYKGPLKDAVGTTTFVQHPYQNGYIKVQSKSLNYRLPFLFKPHEMPFWLLMLLLLLVFYGLLLNIIGKLFALDLPETEVWEAIDKEVLLCEYLNRMLMVIGLPGSNKLTYITQKIRSEELKQDDGTAYIYNPKQPEKNNVLLLDLIEIPDDNAEPASDDYLRWKEIEKNFFSKDYKLVLINHFEYNIKNETTNRIKLNLLERLMVLNKCKIIILSTVHPTAFLDSVNAQAEEALAKGTANASGGKTAIQDLERWHILLGNYRLLIHKIEHHTFAHLDKADAWQQPILKETQYTQFLFRMQGAAIKAAGTSLQQQTIDNTDSIAFKLQVTAHYFYMYLWQSLTKEEKFLLYDLAEDGLVNSFDAYNLSMLINKGVILRDDTTLKLFNRSFRNFILTAIGNTEAMKIKSQIQDNGSWGKLKTPLLVVIFAILAFLLTSQQEAYSKLIAYVSALVAGIPVFVKLLSMFDSSSSQKSS